LIKTTSLNISQNINNNKHKQLKGRQNVENITAYQTSVNEYTNRMTPCWSAVHQSGRFFNVPCHLASSASLKRLAMKLTCRERSCTSRSTRYWWRLVSSETSDSIRSIYPTAPTVKTTMSTTVIKVAISFLSET